MPRLTSSAWLGPTSTARGRSPSASPSTSLMRREVFGSRPLVAQASSAGAAEMRLRRARHVAQRDRRHRPDHERGFLERRSEVEHYLKGIGERNARQILPVLALGLERGQVRAVAVPQPHAPLELVEMDGERRAPGARAEDRAAAARAHEDPGLRRSENVGSVPAARRRMFGT
jgi:hypothetical protein